MISSQNATLPADNTLTIEIPVENPDARDLTGATAYYAVARTPKDAELFRKSTTAGSATFEEGEGGVWMLTVTIAAADTKALKPTTYYHEATIVDADGGVATIMRGNLTVQPTLVARKLSI